jgi:hypothetical protein
MQHRNAVGQRQHFVEVVRDQQDGSQKSGFGRLPADREGLDTTEAVCKRIKIAVVLSDGVCISFAHRCKAIRPNV